MSAKFNCNVLFFLLFAIMLQSCNNSGKQEITKVAQESKLKLRIVNFSRELNNLETSIDNNSISKFSNHYYGFFDIYNSAIIKIGRSADAGYTTRLQDFLNDKTINQIKNSTDSIYKNFKPFENDFTNAFKLYNYYFPKKIVPTIFTFYSGFNCAIAPTDSILGLGLDYFLGANSNYYNLLQLPEYQKRKLSPVYLVPTAMQQWIRTEFESQKQNFSPTLLQSIIDEGKTFYALKKCLPLSDDSLVFGFTQQQLQWCNNSEFAIWSFIIDKKLLYNTNSTNNNRYIADGPFTPGLPRESPARAMCWIGYKIIDKFMQANPKITLAQLMNETSAQQILNRSKYKPKK